MRSSFGLRGRRLALAILGTFALAGGIAYAAIPDAGTGVYHACMLNTHGTIRMIDPATEQCRASNETEITFNQKGQKGDTGGPGAQGPAGTDGTNGTNGTNGVSPTVQQLVADDPNCPAGGAAITDAAGSTAYVCSGVNGHDGANGQPFSGTFTSPNGKYSLKVTDTGVVVSALNGAKIDFSDSAISVTSRGIVNLRSDTGFTVLSGTDIGLHAGTNLSLRGDAGVDVLGGGTATFTAGGNATVSSGGVLALQGGFTSINGGSHCFPAVRVTDTVKAADAYTGQEFVTGLSPGASTVCIGN